MRFATTGQRNAPNDADWAAAHNEAVILRFLNGIKKKGYLRYLENRYLSRNAQGHPINEFPLSLSVAYEAAKNWQGDAGDEADVTLDGPSFATNGQEVRQEYLFNMLPNLPTGIPKSAVLLDNCSSLCVFANANL